MGHIRLGRLPKTKSWRAVVRLLAGGADEDEIFIASSRAIERSLTAASRDPVFVEAVRLLCLIPQAGRSREFGVRLRELGIEVLDSPGLAQLLTATGRHLDRRSSTAGRSDFGELGSGLIDQSQKITVAAMQMADMKVCAQRS